MVFPMSDLATQHDDGVFEPDEETLMSALRNQDDIPILMDIVADHASLATSQEGHLTQSLDDSPAQPENMKSEKQAVEEPKEDRVPSVSLSHELIAKTIAGVLERRLPELVAEVMQALHAADATNKKD